MGFRNKRKRADNSNDFDDEGFYEDNRGPPKEVDGLRLRQVVVTKMASLDRRCKGPLRDIAEVIPCLLRTNPQQRLTAEQLVALLKHIDTGAISSVEIGLSKGKKHSIHNLSFLPAYRSDSDFGFGGGIIVVQRPSG